MKYVVCVVRDQVADVFGQPMFSQSVGIAVRSFGDEVNRVDERNMLNKHSEDFSLYQLGTFEDEGATFELLAKPRQLALAKDLIRG